MQTHLGEYKVIYADPPWLYNDARTYASTGMARSAYECMPVEDICGLPVEAHADSDCMLCLWATMPKLREALQVIDAWGFKYLTVGFVWVKLRRGKEDFPILEQRDFHSGLGHWVNGNAELVLLARRGMPQRLRMDVKQVVVAPVGKHSVKPVEVRRRIERLFPGPYLELFARSKVPGWDVWGDEVDGIDLLWDRDTYS